MILFLPGRLVRLAFFTLAAAFAGFLSAEVTATALCVLVMLAACCRHPIRLELILVGVAALAARYSKGDLQTFKTIVVALLPLLIALGGLYLMSRAVLGPRRGHRCDHCQGRRGWF